MGTPARRPPAQRPRAEDSDAHEERAHACLQAAAAGEKPGAAVRLVLMRHRDVGQASRFEAGDLEQYLKQRTTNHSSLVHNLPNLKKNTP